MNRRRFVPSVVILVALALTAFALPATAAADKRELRAAIFSFDPTYKSFIETLNEQLNASEQVVEFCRAAQQETDPYAQPYLWSAVEMSSDDVVPGLEFLRDLRPSLVRTSKAITRANRGLSIPSRAELFQGYGTLETSIQYFQSAAKLGTEAMHSTAGHNCDGGEQNVNSAVFFLHQALFKYNIAWKHFLVALRRA